MASAQLHEQVVLLGKLRRTLLLPLAPFSGLALLAGCGQQSAPSNQPGYSVGHDQPTATHAPWIHEVQLKRWVDQHKKILIVDVRTPVDYAAGHISGAISVPLPKIQAGYAVFPHREPVVLYCSCPNMEADMASQVLMQKGFHSLRVLKGGFPGWYNDHYPVATGNKPD